MARRKTTISRAQGISASPAAHGGQGKIRERTATKVEFYLPTVFADYVHRVAAWENRSEGAVWRALTVLGLRAYEELARRVLARPSPISGYATPSPAPELYAIDEALAAEVRERLAQRDVAVRETLAGGRTRDAEFSLSQAVGQTYVDPVIEDRTDYEALDLGFEDEDEGERADG